MKKRKSSKFFLFFVLVSIVIPISIIILSSAQMKELFTDGQEGFKTIIQEILRHPILAGFFGKILEPSPEPESEPESVAIYCQIIENVNCLKDSSKNIDSTAGNAGHSCPVSIIDKCFNIDQNGVLFKESPIISGGPFLVIYEKLNRDLTINQQALPPEYLNFILEAKKIIKEKLKLDLIDFTIISPFLNDIEVNVSQGWKIYFDASKDLNQQINILSRVLENGFEPTEYIDLRIENRAYYK